MMPTQDAKSSPARLTPRDWAKKIGVFVLVTILFGWVYGRVSPRMFPAGTRFGFSHGLLHGGMMPLALPALVMGDNVELFGHDNNGRPYKIGYICGINLCGVIFFGSAFWKPRKNQPV